MLFSASAGLLRLRLDVVTSLYNLVEPHAAAIFVFQRGLYIDNLPVESPPSNLSGSSAQKMNYPTKLQMKTPTMSISQPVTVPEKKPRKANSEVRKQQNRIASRNYREKRKRKLQQLQLLLEDDDSSNRHDFTRSTSPYDGRSCSGSVGYERSVASVSPHITAVTEHFSSPQPDHSTIANQTWIPHFASSDEHSIIYDNPYSGPTQQMMTYIPCGPTTSQPAWNACLSTTSATYSTAYPPHYPTYPSHTYDWPMSGFDSMYTHAVHQQEAVTSSYTPSWQYHTASEVPFSIATDSYGRRYCQHEPQ